MKEKNKPKSGSVKIDPDVLKEAKILSTELGVNVGIYVNNAVVIRNMQTRKELKKAK